MTTTRQPTNKDERPDAESVERRVGAAMALITVGVFVLMAAVWATYGIVLTLKIVLSFFIPTAGT